MKKLTLNQAIEATQNVASQMPNKKTWTVHTRLVELMEEVGELANGSR